MFFSVIIPLYNKGDVVVRTLKSVLSQTYKEFELIIVDDGSTDNSIDVVHKFLDSKEWRSSGCEYHVIQQTNSGASAARNRGAKESRGRFLAMLDGDDIWLPSHLSDLVCVYAKFPMAKVLSTADASIYNGKIKNSQYRRREGIMAFNIFDYPLGDYPMCSDTIAIEREYFLSMGGYDTRFSYYEDRALYYKLAEDIGDFYVNYRVSALYYHDAKCSAHTLGRRSYCDYGFLQYANDEILAGKASARMKQCVANSVNHLLCGEVVRRRWSAVEEMQDSFPEILNLLHKHRCFNWKRHKLLFYLWYSLEWMIIHLKIYSERVFCFV